MHSFLRGQDADFGGRSCDTGTRGVGGSWTVPSCSAGEENLLMEEDQHYPSENILVHEFAHTVMAVGMNEDQRQAVISAYFNARSSQLYHSNVYMMANADEYWAEGAQAWFEATVRTGDCIQYDEKACKYKFKEREVQSMPNKKMQFSTFKCSKLPCRVLDIFIASERLWRAVKALKD